MIMFTPTNISLFLQWNKTSQNNDKGLGVMVFNVTFSNISAISWRFKKKSHFHFFTEVAIGVNVAKGDLVILDRPYENFMETDIITGICKRTDKLNVMPRDLLYVLPTTEEPAADTMVCRPYIL